VLKRGLQRHGTFKHGQAEEGGRNNGGRWRAVSPPLRVPQQRPTSPPPSEDAVALPAHELLLKEKMRLVTRPTQRFLITCGVKLPVRVFFTVFFIFIIFIIVGSDLQQLTLVVGGWWVQSRDVERGRWHDARRQKPVDAKDAGGKGVKQHTRAPPRLWLEAKSVARQSLSPVC